MLPLCSLILASRSPRRQYLLREAGIPFTVRLKETNEDFPPELSAEEIALFLCRKKALAFKNEIKKNEALVTADTIVWINGKVLNKPCDEEEAISMLKMLSGKMHQVFSGVSIMNNRKCHSFYSESKVYFKKLSDDIVQKYVQERKPFDKAGAYGAQECLPVDDLPCSANEVLFLEKIGKIHMNTTCTKEEKDPKARFILVEKIEGSYFNVMGFPLREFFAELKQFNCRFV